MRLDRFARLIGARVDGPVADVEVRRIAAPCDAQADDVTYFEPRYGAVRDVTGSRAAGVLVAAPHAPVLDAARSLVVDDVSLACARALAWLEKRAASVPETPPAADVDIAPGAVVSATARIGEGTRIASGVVIGEGVSLGSWCTVAAGAVLSDHVRIGNRVRIGAGAVIGEAGFAFVRDGDAWLQMPSFGSVVIEDDVVVLARAVIHAGVYGDTRIERGCALDSLVLIGHDARLGADTAVAGHSAVAGGARIGARCRIGGRAGIGEGVTIAEGVTVNAGSMVSRSISEAGAIYASGWPAQPHVRWWRQVAALRRAAAPLRNDK